ncbi:hsp70-Hsp90 organizing protein 1 [Plutella xylostella]|uniref:hsp70-Hsp90 organizing protein 1 n=1 Tax=Plutella xylostella TaxID=51655 RepID=UPI002032EFE9|nr:hsp70-Hsp90 organizing protein 1 [Plutella xylostella]
MENTQETKGPPPTAEELKAKGNEAVKNEQYIEAVLHYTQAIKLDPNNYVLYSNRSFAFLKLDQHYLSLQDANETVRLQPQWAKGYFRRAEVEAASGLLDEAIISYTRALQLDPHNPKLLEQIRNMTDTQKKKYRDSQNIIWISTCIGLIIGIVVVILDYTLTENPTLTHPLAMVSFSLALSALGWAGGKGATLMDSWSAGKSLTPPEDLGMGGAAPAEETVIPEKKSKYSRAQARHRYKQGKL